MSYRHAPIDQPGNTLATSLLLAAAAHAFVILGISFSTTEYDNPNNMPILDITMVPNQSATAPDNPDYLANANQDGSGDPDQEQLQPELLASQQPSAAAKETEPAPTPTLTSNQSSHKTKPQAPETRSKTLTGAQLIENSLQMIALDNQGQQQARSNADDLRHTHISARTRTHMYASYMLGWVTKVERVGNLNYPDDARRKGLSGKLLLDVALQPDGSIKNIKLLRSSGQKVLDDAAVRIVQLAAPFAPFPPEIRKETDILHVTRTWEFLETHKLKGK